ncbi:MAG: hypothetical protein JST75_12020 [Bacteroidetes bacterium]|nr:hypothetical protein [Bacteroidota bacterium]
MRIIRAIAFLFICLRVSAQPGDAISPVVNIHGFAGKLVTTSKISFLVDSLNGLDISQVRQKNFSTPISAFTDLLNNDPLHHAFWAKFGLQNNSDSTLLLHIYCGDLDNIDIYFISGNHLQLIQGGSLKRAPVNGSFIEKNYGTTTLSVGPSQSGNVFIKIIQRTQEYDFAGIDIYDKENLYASYASDHENNRHFVLFQVIFQGFLLCQLFYMLFQWVIIRRAEYFYYSIYLLLISLYFLSKYESVYGLDFLFARYPLLKIYLNKTLIIFPYYFYFRFVRSFLEMRVNYPVLNKWIIRIEYFLLIYLAFDLAFILTTFNIQLQRVFYTYILLGVFVIAASFIFYLFQKKQILIYYILSGSLFVGLGNITGLVLTYLDENKHVDFGFHNMLIFSQVGILLEIFCFTAGLSYKSKAAEQEKIKSQEKLIEQLKANELLQSKMQNIRNKIAQDLHDDIGSTLSSISILSNLALKEKDTTQTFEAINEIKDSSINLMEKMDDIVWSINPRNDSLDNLLLRVKRFATTLFEAKNIDYNITIQENISEVKLPMDYRQHIYLILKEAINNLVKYANATKAYIEVNFKEGVLEILVNDNGKGFIMQEYFTGNGLLGMKNRAELMHASLHIDAALNKGTTIRLRIKINKTSD